MIKGRIKGLHIMTPLIYDLLFTISYLKKAIDNIFIMFCKTISPHRVTLSTVGTGMLHFEVINDTNKMTDIAILNKVISMYHVSKSISGVFTINYYHIRFTFSFFDFLYIF